MSYASTSRSRSGCGGSASVAPRVGNAVGVGSTRRGCSCGGSGCSCGGSCGLCEGQDFARPRFFAGQLLTEDDLDLLTSYVVEKNRLHNRNLFGEGVVCGLMVTCDPCGGGKVTVQPGYALDCCGNDLVVPCPQTLDINAMVRRLRIEKGVDCGDPCADEKTRPAKSATLGSSTSTSTSTEPTAPPPLPPAEYCLYLRYCERQTDPVSPYATDDPCGAQACEPTRVREGFSFELRCRNCEEPVPDNLFSRIFECLGNPETAERTAVASRSALIHSVKLNAARRRLSLTDTLERFDEARQTEAEQASGRLEALLKTSGAWTPVDALEVAESAETLASLVADWRSATDEEREALRARRAPIEPLVVTARERLGALGSVEPQEKVSSLVKDPFERDVALETIGRALLWADPEAAMREVSPEERRLISAGVVFNQRLRSLFAGTQAQIKANLIDRLKARGQLADCTLLKDVQAIVVSEDTGGEGDRSSMALTENATDRLTDVLKRYVRECVCGAIDPPCPHCEDPAVLLACLRVEGCEVIDICNLERSFVLTPVAVRYWMPFLRIFGELLERWCCPDSRCEPPRKTAEVEAAATPAAAAASRPPRFVALHRARIERESAFDFAHRWADPTMAFDPARLAALLPPKLSFSPENARRFAFSAAALLDVGSLRRGTTLGSVVTSPTVAPAAGAQPGARAAPKPAAGEVTRAQFNEQKRRLDQALRTITALEARIKDLEKPHG